MRSLFTAYWTFTKYLDRALKDSGLNVGNPKVVLYLMNHEGCNQKELAENCYVETATLSTVLSNMESSGLIERKKLETDKRTYAIYPTEKGRRIIESVRRKLEATIDDALRDFSDREKGLLREYLERVTDNLT